MDPGSMLLQDFINAPSKAESILDNLTTEQIQLIEATINSVKKRKLTNSAAIPPSPPSEAEDAPMPLASSGPHSASNTNTVSNPPTPSPQSAVAAAIANALATAMTNAVANSIQQQQQQRQQQEQQKQQLLLQQQKQQKQVATTDVSKQQNTSIEPPTEPLAQVKNGVEWVSFVYSHNRVMKNYTIRTDLHTISLEDIDDKFKTDNCVYPRANLPKDQYKGNRWSYETECNVLGWKLAWLNRVEISGKRGLIQRAVDSYRNRYPSMRSRRVARQAKLMNGTLRKRKQRGDEEDALMELMTSLATSAGFSCSNNTNNMNTITPISNGNHAYVTPTTLDTAIVKPASHPKTIAMEDLATGARCRIKINVETVSLDYIPHDFRLANSPFPRHLHSTVSNGRTRSLEEKMCNELAWKLAWLNPKILAGKKNMLQRAIDLYRTKFIPSMPPRKHSSRQSPVLALMNNASSSAITPLTTSALSAQNAQYQNTAKKDDMPAHHGTTTTPPSASPTMSCISGTTASLDFADCLSLADENITTEFMDNNSNDDIMRFTASPSSLSESPHLPPSFDESSTTISASSGSNSVACTPSPPVSSELFRLAMDEMYDAFMLPPTASVDDDDTFMFTNLDGEENHPTKTTSDNLNNTKLYDQSFLGSPSLPSSALQQDLLVKLENVDDFADLAPFF